MKNAVLNVFGSIIAKIGVVLTVMAALTGASIGVSIWVFGSIAGRVGELDAVYLPALHNSDRVIIVSGDLQEGLSSLLLARNSDQLQAVVAEIEAATGMAEQAIAALPAEQVDKMNANLAAVRASLDALVEARGAEFSAGSQVLLMRQDIEDFGIGLFAMLSGMAEAGYEDLVLNGDETIAEIDDTLKTLVGRDFAALRLLLEARSEINLVSGVSLALASSRDPALNAILADLGRAAVARLGDMTPKMQTIPGLETIGPQTEEARAIFDQVITGGSAAAAARRDEIVILRQSVENDFAIVQDDLIFAVAMNAEEAGEGNGVKIRGLLDKQVAQIKYIAELRAGMRNVITESLETVLTETPEEQDVADEQLNEAVTNLSDLLAAGDAEIMSAFEPLIALVAPEGISAVQREYVDARMMRSILAEQATSSVAMIVADARAVADDAATGIAAATDAIDTEIIEAGRLMQGIALACILVLIAAPVFSFFIVVRPLLAVTNATERLAKGDLEVVGTLGRRRAEIGRMIAALGVFRDGLIEKARLEAEERANVAAREQAARTAAAERAAQQERERAILAEQEQRERDREAAEQARREAAQAAAEAERQARQAIQEQVVRELAQGLGKLAEGDLRATITSEFGEGYEQLRTDFNAAVETLEDVIGRIQQSVASIHSGSGEISHATDDLSRRTERTAATLEQSAAALTELTASVSSAAVGASEADSLVTSVRKSAARSSEVVNEAVVAMGEIENSSRKISKITDVIDDIAFQTNLLALNAGVEAARAGDAGRGFAVVASEVRALAQRSSEAAREINSLISESGVQVSRGVDRVDQVGKVLREIVDSIAEISGHVAGIAASTREQSAGITEINTAIGQLDQTTQQNAAMVEETTAASHTLTEEASTLSSTISRFVLSADWAGQSAAPARKRA